VNKYAKKHNVTYKDAMTLSKSTYKKQAGKGVCISKEQCKFDEMEKKKERKMIEREEREMIEQQERARVYFKESKKKRDSRKSNSSIVLFCDSIDCE